MNPTVQRAYQSHPQSAPTRTTPYTITLLKSIVDMRPAMVNGTGKKAQ
jgi:hypothetical protein